MVDLAIGAAIASLKTAGEIAGSFIKIRDQTMIRAKVIELQSIILSAQSSALAAQGEQSALLQEKRDLERHIADLEAWNREKDRYELKEVVVGVFAYSLKPDAQSADPPHRICANCYERGRKSVLQKDGAIRDAALACPACRTNFKIGGVGVQHLKGEDGQPIYP